jgi:hypothetical protein
LVVYGQVSFPKMTTTRGILSLLRVRDSPIGFVASERGLRSWLAVR